MILLVHFSFCVWNLFFLTWPVMATGWRSQHRKQQEETACTSWFLLLFILCVAQDTVGRNTVEVLVQSFVIILDIVINMINVLRFVAVVDLHDVW